MHVCGHACMRVCVLACLWVCCMHACLHACIYECTFGRSTKAWASLIQRMFTCMSFHAMACPVLSCRVTGRHEMCCYRM